MEYIAEGYILDHCDWARISTKWHPLCSAVLLTRTLWVMVKSSGQYREQGSIWEATVPMRRVNRGTGG